MRPIALLLLLALELAPCTAQAPVVQARILVYTHNGKGYVHDNIAASVAAIRKMGAENGFSVDATDDSSVFTDATLKQYKALVFANTNNEAFASDDQRESFKRFIKAGGGFVGIHSASGSERGWPYYWEILGGKFLRHPKLQSFTVRVQDPNHPAVQGVPTSFQWEDECYFIEHLNPNIHPLLVTDPSKLDHQHCSNPRSTPSDNTTLPTCQLPADGRQ